MEPEVVICIRSTRKSSPAKPGWLSASSRPGNGEYQMPPVASSTVTLNPDPLPSNSKDASTSPHAEDGCCEDGVLEDEAPMVK